MKEGRNKYSFLNDSEKIDTYWYFGSFLFLLEPSEDPHELCTLILIPDVNKIVP